MADQTTPPDTDLPEDDVAAPAPAAKKPIVPIAIAAIVAAVLGGGVAMFLGSGSGDAAAAETEPAATSTPDDGHTEDGHTDDSHTDDGHEPLASAPTESAVPGDLVTSGPHTVNLNGGGFVRLTVGVLFEEHHTEEEEDAGGGGHGGGGGDDEDGPDREAITAADGIITHLRDVDADSFAVDAEQASLKAAIGQVFADAYHLDVIDVYLIELVVTG